MITSQIPIDFAAALNDELISHYDSLERLYSLLLAEGVALEKQDLNILQHITKAKAVLLKDLDDKKLTLDACSIELAEHTDTAAIASLSGPIARIKRLAEAVIHVGKSNSLRIQGLYQTTLASAELESSYADPENSLGTAVPKRADAEIQ